MNRYHWAVLLLYLALSAISCKAVRTSMKAGTVVFIPDASLFKESYEYMTPLYRYSFFYKEAGALNAKEFYLTRNDSTKIIADAPVSFVETGAGGLPVTVYPGEVIHVKMGGYGTLIYETDSQVRNIELNCNSIADSLFYIIHNRVLADYIKTDLPVGADRHEAENEITLRLNILMQKQQDCLDSLTRIYTLPSQFVTGKRKQILEEVFSDEFFLYQSKIRPLCDSITWAGIFRQQIQQFNTLTENEKTFIPFEGEADMLLGFLEKENSTGWRIDTATDYINQYNIIDHYFKGAARDYLLSKLAYTTASRRIEIPEKYIKSVIRKVGNNSYKSAIKAQIKRSKKIASSRHSTSYNNLLTFGSNRKTTIENIIKAAKGNMILIDFWASWCVPCREEIPFLKQLQATYKGKGIQFISISLDKETDKWKNISSIEKVDRNSYLLINPAKSGFIDTYKIHTIPRYMLISKDGNIIDDDAPYPENKALAELIEKHL